MSVDFFLHNMLGYTELNVDTTKNHLALTSYFYNPSFKNAVLLEIPLSSRKSDNVSIVMSTCATMFEPAILIRHENGTHRLVTVMIVHISIISTKLNHVLKPANINVNIIYRGFDTNRNANTYVTCGITGQLK